MERKSLLPGFPWEKYEKDEKEEKRISLKKRKRVTDDEDENNLWRVKCGTKRGILDVEKLKKGEACIEYKGCLYSPPDFEKLAGKEPCRKWKSTIFYNEKPLQFWFEEGYLTTPGYRQKKRKRKSCDSTEESEEDHVDDEDEDEEQEDEHMDEEYVGDDESSSEDDEDEESDNDEDKSAPTVASNHTDSSDIKERVTATIPTPGKHALEMKEKARHHPGMPRSEVTENPRDVAKNTANQQQNVNKEPEEKLKKTTSTISTPVKSALKIKEVKGVINSLPEGLSRSEEADRAVVCVWTQKARDHPDTTRPEVTENPRDVAKNTPIKQQNVKKQPEDELKKKTSDTISTLVKPALKIKEVKGVVNSLPEGLYNIKHHEKARDHPDTTRSEVTENPRDVAKNTPIKQQNVKKQPEEEPKERKEDHVEHEDEDEEQEDEHMDEDDVGEDEPSTEKDEDEEGDNDEDESVPAVASNHTDSSDIKERVTPTIPTPGQHALEMKEVKGIINILPEKIRHRPDMTRSEVSGNNRDVAKNTANKQQNVKKEPEEELSIPIFLLINTNDDEDEELDLNEELALETEQRDEEMEEPENEREVVNSGSDVSGNLNQSKDQDGPSCEALPVSDECEHKDVPCSGHSVAEVQSMMPEMSVDMSEAPSPEPSASSGLNTMDLDQLKREKMKIQLKVLKLQQEYYTLKIKELKK